MNPIKFTFIFISALSAFCLHGKMAKPNILWITSEDNSIEWISCYGSKNAKTPNIDQLAQEGFRYLYCFDNGAVCAPTRSSWITGMHSISNGTQPSAADSRFPPRSAFTTSFCKRPVTSPAIVRKLTTTSEHQVVAIPRTSGTIPGVITQAPGRKEERDSPSSPYTTSGTATNPGPLAIIRTNPLTPRK